MNVRLGQLPTRNHRFSKVMTLLARLPGTLPVSNGGGQLRSARMTSMDIRCWAVELGMLLWTPSALQADASLQNGGQPPLEAGCRALFDGITLDGWTVLGTAPFTVEDGAIVGTPVQTRENTFLRSNETFDDFELSLAFSYQEGMFNSGVQFRSAVYTEETPIRVRARDGKWHDWTAQAGRVYGYQVDIDPSDRAWTGEIYDEAARGWLETFDKSPVLRAIEAERWHRLRIRAVGSRIQTWLDGYPVVDLVDDERAKGFIALQVHGIYEPEQLGKSIAFRDLRICDLADSP